MAPLTLLVLSIALAGRPFAEERVLLDRRLETLRRILPDGHHPPADRTLVLEMAQSTGLESLDVQPRPPFDSRSPWADVVVDLSGVGSYDEVDRFFRQAALSPRLIDVESVALTPATADAVRVVAVLRVPYRPELSPLPAPPEGLRGPLAGVPKPQADAFLRDQALVLAKSDAIGALRHRRRNPRLFLSEAAAVTRGRPVILNQATLGDEFFLATRWAGDAQGVRGPPRARASDNGPGAAGRQGPCFRFEVRGRAVVGLTPDPAPTSQPFSLSVPSDRDPPGASVLRPRPGAPSSGALDLRRATWTGRTCWRAVPAHGRGFRVDPTSSGVSDFPGVELKRC